VDQLERAKWRFWHGQGASELIRLVHLSQWARCFKHIRVLAKLGHPLLDMIRYLELNADSLPNYGKRFRSRFRISTGFAESAVNEIMAKRMNKKQQMRSNRHTVQQFLGVRIHVLNDILERPFAFGRSASVQFQMKPLWQPEHPQLCMLSGSQFATGLRTTASQGSSLAFR
jgi:hypothetical protein